MERITNLKELKNKIADRELMVTLFYKPDNGTCTKVKNKLLKFEKLHNIPVAGINVNRVKDIHTNYNIDSVPTVLVLRNSIPAELIKGEQTLAFYEKLLTKIETGGDSNADYSHDVTIYTTPTCQYCSAVKAYLDKNNIQYKEIDVAEDQNAAQELV